ncbi:hypothetical protein WH266_17870 [Pseudomonas sp. MYb330]|uniref:Uncharacterized protein n=1 Tax=Pseudomonas sp. MYb327 TaxID=2745230 RepID=A0AAU8E661_9PSED
MSEDLIAGKPAPTKIGSPIENGSTQPNCRSWLASDGGRQFSAMSEGLIAGKPAPTKIGVAYRERLNKAEL